MLKKSLCPLTAVINLCCVSVWLYQYANLYGSSNGSTTKEELQSTTNSVWNDLLFCRLLLKACLLLSDSNGLSLLKYAVEKKQIA